MVTTFFCGSELPKYVTYTNLVLISKKLQSDRFTEMRPILLSNFINKIFSRIIHERIKKILPDLISPEQTGFITGRSISKNILLAQDIITKIRKRGKLANLVIKLDMMKSYDRVSWLFLTKVLRRMGMGERVINMVFILISNNSYLILINSQVKGFFKSSRGIKHGDPLSPTLFILTTEVLSRKLNSLHNQRDF